MTTEPVMSLPWFGAMSVVIAFLWICADALKDIRAELKAIRAEAKERNR